MRVIDHPSEKGIGMKWITFGLIASFVASTGNALAHGEQKHTAKEPAAARKEQKPWGIAGDASSVSRTVEIRMLDAMRFTPDRIDVKQGETVRFVMKNTGKLQHELVIGTRKALDDHAALMVEFPNMEHDEPYMAHVAPGDTGEIVWLFNRAGDFDYGCLIPGHYDAGMMGSIRVVPGAQAASTIVPAGAVAFVQADQPMTEGEVRKIDKEAKKITLKHAEIGSLGMPAMTMVFQVRDPAMLDAVKSGQKVRFSAENVNGALVVTRIEAAK